MPRTRHPLFGDKPRSRSLALLMGLIGPEVAANTWGATTPRVRRRVQGRIEPAHQRRIPPLLLNAAWSESPVGIGRDSRVSSGASASSTALEVTPPQAKAALSQAIRNRRCAETEKQAGAAWLPNRERQRALCVSRKEEAATLFVKSQLVEML